MLQSLFHVAKPALLAYKSIGTMSGSGENSVSVLLCGYLFAVHTLTDESFNEGALY